MAEKWLEDLKASMGNERSNAQNGILPPMSESSRSAASLTIQEKMHTELLKAAHSMKIIAQYNMMHFDEGMLQKLDVQLLAIQQCVANCRHELIQLYALNEAKDGI